MNTKKVVGTLSVVAAAAMISGCEIKPSLKESQVGRITGAITTPRTFEPADYRLRNNKFFLWREKTNARMVKEVQILADEIVDADETGFKLRRDLEPAERGVSEANAAWRTARLRVTGLQRELTALQTELAEEEAKDPRNDDRVAELRAQIAAKEAEVTEAVAERDRLAEAKARAQEGFDRLSEESRVLVESTRTKIARIMELVEWYSDQPDAVSLKVAEDGEVSVSISNWNLDDGNEKRSFSTEDGTIGKASYEREGGVFKFEVYTNPGEVFEMKLARANYGDEHGRVFFAGDVKRKRRGERKPALGVAKLVAGQEE